MRTDDRSHKQPSIEDSHNQGDSYEVHIPDTLDLADRADLAINAMTRMLDPERQYELYMTTDIFQQPPILVHDASQPCIIKWIGALPLMRLMSGSTFNIAIDRMLMDIYLSNIGGDGAYYMPTPVDEPWLFSNMYGHRWVDENIGPYGMPFAEGRAILTLMVWDHLNGNPYYRELAAKKVDRLLEFGRKRDGGTSFQRIMVSGARSLGKEEPGAVFDSFLPYGGPAHYYRLTGYEPALELARGQTAFLRRSIFTPDGGIVFHHFHGFTCAILDMLEYYLAVNDEHGLRLIQSAYEQLKSVGNLTVGFFPEVWKEGWAEEASTSSMVGFAPQTGSTQDEPVELSHYGMCESCQTADMVLLALKLTQAGLGDYWDDVDRYVRNQFVENQLTSTDWIVRDRPAHFPPSIRSFTGAGSVEKRIADQNRLAEQWPGQVSRENAAERTVGAWASQATGNEIMSLGSDGLVAACCTGNCSRTLYYVWDSIVMPDSTGVQVNLLLNRASPWLDVNSYIPNQGRVDLKIKQSLEAVRVRIPEWIATGETMVEASVSGQTRAFTWQGRYVDLGPVSASDDVTITFPIYERTVVEKIGGAEYELVLRGNDVVSIDPAGAWGALYRRSHRRSSEVEWRKVSRFVADRRVPL